jgi:death-on-curing protein
VFLRRWAVTEIEIVSLEEIIRLHDAWIERLGGSPGIWSPNVLMYAFECQQSPYYTTLYRKAAHLAGRIIKEHAFVDGNKQTGYSCAVLFLARKGVLLMPDFDDAYEVFRRLALGTNVPGELTYEEFARWLQINSVSFVQE